MEYAFDEVVDRVKDGYEAIHTLAVNEEQDLPYVQSLTALS